jgi:hypothetical protein
MAGADATGQPASSAGLVAGNPAFALVLARLDSSLRPAQMTGLDHGRLAVAVLPAGLDENLLRFADEAG